MEEQVKQLKGFPCGDCGVVFKTGEKFSEHVPKCKPKKK